MKEHCYRLLGALLLAMLFMVLPLRLPAATIVAIRIPTAVADAGGAGTTGYPYAIYVQITGWTACASNPAYVKFYSGSNNEYMWSNTNVWSNTTTFAAANQPVVNIDASGNWSGWIYLKHNTSLGVSGAVRAAKFGSTSTNLTSTPVSTYTVLNMTPVSGTGGWIVRSSSPAVNKGILAYSGANVVGTYRTEDNSITEGYSYSAGGFKIAVPIGVIDSLVTINDDNSRDQAFVGPWVITAGSETDASVTGAVGKGTASVSPTLMPGNVVGTINLKIYGAAPDTIRNVRIVVPPLWSWSEADTAITVVGAGSPVKAVVVDTITVSGAELLGGDSLQVTISSIAPPDSTGFFAFLIGTGHSADSVFAIAVPPQVLVYGTPMQISDAKVNDVNGVPLLSGRWVTVRGIVSAANEFGGPAFVQDNTGGIAVYGSIFQSSVTIGDEVIVTGIMSPYAGLNELGSPYVDEVAGHGNAVTPLVATAAALRNDGSGGVENYEGLLVRVNTVTVTDTFGSPIANWTVSGSGTNYRIHDGSGYVDLRVDNNVNFANTPAPQGVFDVIGVLSQYKPSSPYIGGYQLQPRLMTDILSKGPVFATTPVESNLTSSSFRVSWATVNDGSTRLRYGTSTAYELGVLAPDDVLQKPHVIDLSSLTAATIYHVQAFSVSGADTSTAGDLVVSTSSPVASTGRINVYFNKSIDPTVAIAETANGNSDLVSLLISRIYNAKRTIDACLYSLSGSAQGDAIASELVSAKNRGVKVRIICEADNSGGSGFGVLNTGGITVINDKFDAVWNGQGLMHDKFFVIDGRGGAPPESARVWTGSWNPTYPGTASDRQNSIEILDQALAGAYTAEFNEMWGSTSETPNASASRFGARKSDITPHNFLIKGVPVSLYFSPSDHTTGHITAALGHAQHSIAGAVLTFTRKEIADTIIARKNAGDKTRIVVDNNTDQGNQFAYLQGAGVDIHLKGGGGGLLHHKYATIDAEQSTGDQYLVTGSHNWSSAAENSNDENTLIIKDSRVANLYLQEFAARYYEAGGTDSIHLALAPRFAAAPAALAFDSVVIGDSKTDSFFVSNAGKAPLSVLTATSTNARFIVAPTTGPVSPAESLKFTVTFTPLASAAQNGFIIMTHNAAGSPDTVALHGTGKVVGGPVSIPLSLRGGWNMVSLPLALSSPRRDSVFPSAVSQLYAYDRGYVTRDSLARMKGYWVKIPSDQVVSLTGLTDTADTATLAPLWNMIGAISSAVAAGSLTQDPPDNVLTEYFGYDTAYHIADTLKPGRAYWVKAHEAGKLIFHQTPGVLKARPAGDRFRELNSLTITDGRGHHQTLYAGIRDGGADESFEMPPVPPEGAFDARFASGRIAEVFAHGAEATLEFPLRLQGATPPVTIRWEHSSGDGLFYGLDRGTGDGRRVRLTGSSAVTVAGEIKGALKLIVSSRPLLPDKFMLSQNYPNPFNPTTTIPFALPRQSTVTLKVYNLLGEVVATPLDRVVREGGYYEEPFDASSLPSGIYFYRFTAVATDGENPAFQQVRKIVLLR